MHLRIQEFLSRGGGGGGGVGQSDKESSDNVFFIFLVLSLSYRWGGGGGGEVGQSDKERSDSVFFIFLVLSLSYRCQIVNFKENYHIFQGSGGGPTFSREGEGGNFFQGVQLLIPYRNPYNL